MKRVPRAFWLLSTLVLAGGCCNGPSYPNQPYGYAPYQRPVAAPYYCPPAGANCCAPTPAPAACCPPTAAAVPATYGRVAVPANQVPTLPAR